MSCWDTKHHFFREFGQDRLLPLGMVVALVEHPPGLEHHFHLLQEWSRWRNLAAVGIRPGARILRHLNHK